MPDFTTHTDRVRELFDEQVRRGTARDGTGSEVTSTNEVVRWCADGDLGWSEIAWSNLDESNADVVIGQQVEFFAAKGLGFAWRVVDTDSPTDLGARLERAGFEFVGTSELMIARVTDVPLDVALPPGVTLSRESGPAAIDRLIEVHERVFGIDHSQLRRSLLLQLTSSPQLGELVVAMAEGVPVASSRVDFLPDREFAGLWGGSTLPEWRGKGLFRAMVAHRSRHPRVNPSSLVSRSSRTDPCAPTCGDLQPRRPNAAHWASVTVIRRTGADTLTGVLVGAMSLNHRWSSPRSKTESDLVTSTRVRGGQGYATPEESGLGPSTLRSAARGSRRTRPPRPGT